MRIKSIIVSLVIFFGFLFASHSALANVFSINLKPIIKIDQTEFRPSSEVQLPGKDTRKTASSSSFDKIQNILNQHMGQPYVWGGNGPNSFDCSGLTKFVFEQALNIHLQRTAEQQFNQFEHIPHRNVGPGDLIFFSYNHGKTIDHVGIVVKGNNMMVDAQSRGVVRESYMAPWWTDSIVGYARVFN